ncbi:MAG: hypothetical protein AAF219_09200 [Myxococcota bacterium]
MWRLRDGDFLNSYPYLSNDSFDYITQGVALVDFLSGEPGNTWPFLRGPGFVVVSALDYLLGGSGLAFVSIQVLGLAFTLWCIADYGRRVDVSPFVTAACLTSAYFSSMGYFRLWVLADPLCGAFMAGSLLASQRYVEQSSDTLYVAALFAFFAGLTQSYGVIPFGIVSIVHCIRIWRVHRRVALPPLYTLIGLGVALILSKLLWAGLIPHDGTPTQFSLLRLSLEMAPFYANTWGFMLAPFFVAFALGLVVAPRHELDGFFMSLVYSLVAFMTLTFFYQYRESRFAFIYAPLLLMLVVGFFRNSRGSPLQFVTLGSAFALVPALCGFLLAPHHYWFPEFAKVRVAPGATWFVSAIRASALDRFRVEEVCGHRELCPESLPPATKSNYQTLMLREYYTRIAND